MTDLTTNQPATIAPGGCFPPPKPYNFDPHTGLPIEYDEHGAPYSPIVFVTAPQLPEGVAGYDPYTGKPLDENGHPVHGEHNPFGQHTFTTRLEDRGGVDPAGHVVAQRPLYDSHTGLPIHYDEHGIGMVNLIGVIPPPGVAGYDPYTGEPVDEHGEVVPGATNPHRLPGYDSETGLPITYDENGNPMVPNVHVENPPGVHGYHPITGQPLDEYGEVIEGVENPNWRPEDRPAVEYDGHPNFDPQTGVPLEYDEHGNPYPAVDVPENPTLPDGVAGYDPNTGEPVDEHGKVVEGVDNPYGDHTFTTDLEGRAGVDPSGHVIAQRPMYDGDTGLPIYYNEQGKPYVFHGQTEKPDGVDHYDEKTGEPLDPHGRVVEGEENPYQRPNYDASSGRPIQYDQNGYQVPQPPVYLPPQDGVSGYDPKTGDPVDEDGNPVEGASNPWLLDDEDVLFRAPDQSETGIPFLPDTGETDETGRTEETDETRDELGDTLPTEPLDPGPFVPEGEVPVDPEATPDGLGRPGDVFGRAEGPDGTPDATDPTTATTPPTTGDEVTVPEQRDTDDADPFAHTEKPQETPPTTDTEETTELRDEPVSHEPATTEPAAETSPSHETASLDDTPDPGADAADHADTVTAG